MGADKDSVIVKWTGAGPWQLSVYQAIILASGDTCQSLTKTLNVYPFLPPNISGVKMCAWMPLKHIQQVVPILLVISYGQLHLRDRELYCPARVRVLYR
ncbi:MAG: hypothetical protein R2764_00820 [Bacteroidales bacterium]